MTPYAGTNRIRFYGTLSACALSGQAPRSTAKSSDGGRGATGSGRDTHEIQLAPHHGFRSIVRLLREGCAIVPQFLIGVVHLTLFVAGDTFRSQRAIANLRRLGDERLGGRCELEIVDVRDDPQAAETERILTTPTLIKRSPGAPRRVTGDLVDLDQVLMALSLTSGGES
jgi:circadian clock protein KaiB